MNRILALYIFLLLCGTVSAQQIVEWSDLQTITDKTHGARSIIKKAENSRYGENIALYEDLTRSVLNFPMA